MPASEDLPTYFIPMLCDVDRNTAYEAAIRETIADFTSEHGRAPTVLDVGAGTGLLTAMALRHGAARVVALEANSTTASLAQAQLEASFPAQEDAERYTVVQAISFKLEAGTAEPFDIVVSELLGSMIHSESMYIYLWDLLMRGVVRNHGTRQAPQFITVPKAAIMTLTPYTCPTATTIPTGIPYVNMGVVHDAVYGSAAPTGKLEWTQDEARRFMLATADAKPLAPAVTVLEEEYNLVSGGVRYCPTFDVQLPVDTPVKDVIFVLEWQVQLSPNVVLDHTLQGVSALTASTQLARWVAWGHLFAPLAGACGTRSRNDRYRLELTYRPADLEVKIMTAPRRTAKTARVAGETAADAAAQEAPTSAPSNATSVPKGKGKRRIQPQAVEGEEEPEAEDQEQPAMAGLSHRELAAIVIGSKAIAEKGYTSV